MRMRGDEIRLSNPQTNSKIMITIENDNNNYDNNNAVGFLKRLAHKLAIKWHSSYSVVTEFVRARLLLAILRATALCIRGSRKFVTGVRFALDDGAGMCLHF